MITGSLITGGMGSAGSKYYSDDASYYPNSPGTPSSRYADDMYNADDYMSGSKGIGGMGGMMGGGGYGGMMGGYGGMMGGKMGGGMMGSGGMMGGGGGGGGMMSCTTCGGGKGGIYPQVDDITFLDDAFFDDAFFPGNNCQMVSFNETFAVPGPSLFLAPDTTATVPGTPELPGTVFLFERLGVLEIDGVTPITGTTITGSCTRTTVGDNGGGICQLVFIDDAGYSISVDGFLPAPLGGPLAITGGTGSMVGVIGEMDFFPIFSSDINGTVGDIFLDVVRYEVIADIGLIVCP